MWHKAGKIQNIKKTEITKTVIAGDKRICFRLQDALIGEVDDHEEILDEVLIDHMLEQIAKVLKDNSSAYNPVPREVVIRAIPETSRADGREAEDRAGQIFECCEPRFSIDQIALNETTKEQIRTAIAAVTYRNKMIGEWGMSQYFDGSRAIILNFYGKPGTGKSMTAEAVAKELGKKVYRINYADLESKYVGDTPKNIRGVFATAAKDKAVLIFDEADSFLGKRLSSVTQSADYGVNIARSVMLMELEKYDGVVVFTTNLLENYDEAFKRRILLSIYFDLPDEAARTQIWKSHRGDKLPVEEMSTPEYLAAKYEDVSGADIKDMVFYAALHTLQEKKEIIARETWNQAYEVIKERYCNREKQNVNVVSTERITEEQYRQEIKGSEE